MYIQEHHIVTTRILPNPTRPMGRVIGLLLFVFTLISCQSDEEHLKAEPYQVLESIVSSQDLFFEDALNTLLKIGDVTEEQIKPYKKKVDMAALRARKYKAHIIKYHTTDPHGNPVIASGVVYYPKTGNPRGVIEAVSFNKVKSQCPSKQLANLQVIMGMAGYIVLVPDLIGCGATESMVIPYLYDENAAKVSADFRLAATELVRNIYGRSMPTWTLVTGISLSASEALALARHYHKHPELGVHVNQIWICGGVYNPKTVMEHQLRSRYSEYAFLPSALYSINHYEALGLNLQEIFRGKLSQHYEEWCTGGIELFELSERLGSDISQYLNLDFFTDSNHDYQKILESLSKLTTPHDWVPTCPVHIYHARNDTFVPITSADELVEYLRSAGAKVDYVVTEEGHIENIVAMGSDLVEILYK